MEQTHVKLWKSCLEVIKDNIPGTAFDTWFAPIVPLKYEDNIFVLQVPSPFFVEYIEEKYIDLLGKTLYRVAGEGTRLEYRVLVDKSNDKKIPLPSAAENSRVKTGSYIGAYAKNRLPDIDPRLNHFYTFGNLIEGAGNKLARTAGMSIAKEPGKTIFNPLFVYGQSGVGKTHLANAIGVLAKQIHPEKRVLYVPANTFQTQYTDAVRSNTANDFLNFYQTIDLLIVDDIQEFVGKSGTQNTFFHIFNHLHQSGKQLVLTSDRSPVLMSDLEDRLLTRFKWGLSAEIEKPDFDMRKAILESKIYRDGLEVPPEVVDFIAEHVVDSIRDLEGVLASLMAHSTLINTPLDMELTRKVINRIVSVKPKVYTVEKIRDVVCDYFDLSVEAISTKSRKREVVQARQIAMYLSKELTGDSPAVIGRVIGKRDRATVLHAYKLVNDLMDTDKHFRTDVMEIRQRLKA